MTKKEDPRFESMYHPGTPQQTLEHVDAVLALLQNVTQVDSNKVERWGQFLILESVREALHKTGSDLREAKVFNLAVVDGGAQ